jgi:hypothetical protein
MPILFMPALLLSAAMAFGATPTSAVESRAQKAALGVLTIPLQLGCFTSLLQANVPGPHFSQAFVNPNNLMASSSTRRASSTAPVEISI